MDGQAIGPAVPELTHMLNHAVQNRDEANTHAVSQILKDQDSTGNLKKAATNDSDDLVKHMVNNRLVHKQAISAAVSERTRMMSHVVQNREDANTLAVSQIINDENLTDESFKEAAAIDSYDLVKHIVNNRPVVGQAMRAAVP